MSRDVGTESFAGRHDHCTGPAGLGLDQGMEPENRGNK